MISPNQAGGRGLFSFMVSERDRARSIRAGARIRRRESTRPVIRKPLADRVPAGSAILLRVIPLPATFNEQHRPRVVGAFGVGLDQRVPSSAVWAANLL